MMPDPTRTPIGDLLQPVLERRLSYRAFCRPAVDFTRAAPKRDEIWPLRIGGGR